MLHYPYNSGLICVPQKQKQKKLYFSDQILIFFLFIVRHLYVFPGPEQRIFRQLNSNLPKSLGNNKQKVCLTKI